MKGGRRHLFRQRAQERLGTVRGVQQPVTPLPLRASPHVLLTHQFGPRSRVQQETDADVLAEPANVIVVVDLRTVEVDADAAKIEAFPQSLVVVRLCGLLAVDHEPLVKLLDQSREEIDHLAGDIG